MTTGLVFADTVVLNSSHEQANGWLVYSVFSAIFCDYTRKIVPITGRAHSLYFWSFQQIIIERRGDRTTDLSIYTSTPPNLFIIHNKHNMNTIFIYIHTYMNCSSQVY